MYMIYKIFAPAEQFITIWKFLIVWKRHVAIKPKKLVNEVLVSFLFSKLIFTRDRLLLWVQYAFLLRTFNRSFRYIKRFPSFNIQISLMLASDIPQIMRIFNIQSRHLKKWGLCFFLSISTSFDIGRFLRRVWIIIDKSNF